MVPIPSLKNVVICLIAGISFLFCGCSHSSLITVGSSLGDKRDAKFADYKTYTFVDAHNIVKISGDFEEKDYVIELAEKKLASMGLKRDDKNPDFAVFMGYHLESDTESYKRLTPTYYGGGNNAYDVEEVEKTNFTHFLLAVLFDARIFPKNIDIQKMFNLEAYFKKMSKLIEQGDKNSIKFIKNFQFCEDCYEIIWTGSAAYHNLGFDLFEETIPFMIDEIFDYYLIEHIPISREKNLGDTPNWLEE
ncbi:MAG TPA: DUF4136 domain-containing protein [Elusimicrobiales bacterium]|nr:DUF4136 domain-containing protein [Elusimicrobiales bacterium]